MREGARDIWLQKAVFVARFQRAVHSIDAPVAAWKKVDTGSDQQTDIRGLGNTQVGP